MTSDKRFSTIEELSRPPTQPQPTMLPIPLQMMQRFQNLGNSLRQQNDQLMPFQQNIRGGVGSVLAAPGNFVDAVGEIPGAVAQTELGQNAVDAFTKTQAQIKQEKAQAAHQKDMDAFFQQARETELTRARENAFDEFLGPQGQQSVFDLGSAPSGGGGGYALPTPPPNVDYSGVQDAIDQTRPEEVDQVELEERRKGAILAGLLGGMLNTAMRDDASFGQILGGGGLGVLSGMAAADKDKQEAEANFKKAIDQYWLRTADVRQAQAESDADYANRVWQTKIKQLEINARSAGARAAANQIKLHNTAQGIMVEETVDGRRQLRMLDTGDIDRGVGMKRAMTKMLGGVEGADAKADAIVSEVLARKDPTYAMPKVALYKLKDNGMYLDYIENLSSLDEDFKKTFNSLGADLQGAPILDEDALTSIVERRRDAMLMDLMIRSDVARTMALKMAGMDIQLANERER